MKRLRRHALSRATLMVCAGLSSAAAARAQVLPQVPTAPLQAASEAAPAFPVAGASTPTPQVLPPAAPSTYIVPSVAILVTQSSNANFGAASAAQSDTIMQVVPRLFLATEHARWQARANIGLDGQYYTRGTEPNVIAPQGYASLHSELVDRLFFFDASMNAQRYATSPYVSQGGPVQSTSYTSTQWRISPYVDRVLRPGLRLTARSDDTWTTVSNTPSAIGLTGGRYLDQTVRLEQAPLAWGYTLAAQQTYATYTDEPFAWLRDLTMRAIVNYAFTPRLVLGLIGGGEKVQAYGAEKTASIYGVRGQWNGDPRANARLAVERRYFGTGWDLQASAGTPIARLSLGWTRDAISYLSPLANGNSSASNLSLLLDNLLAGQYPNPFLRAQAVQSLLGSAGLPPGLSTSGGFYTSSSVLQNNLVVTGLVLRPRDSYALSLYRNRTEDLFLPGQQLLQLIQSTSADNVQSGAAFNYGHRLTPLDNLNLTVQREVDTGFGLNQGNEARQTNYIVQLDHRFSLRTIAIVGARRRFLTSSQVGNANETGLFAGLVHRF